jgi:hypothetical protein
MPREPTVNIVRASDSEIRTRNTYTSSSRYGDIEGRLVYTPMVAIRCDAPGCGGVRLVGDPSNPGPHAPHHVGGYLVDCIGRIIEVSHG